VVTTRLLVVNSYLAAALVNQSTRLFEGWGSLRLWGEERGKTAIEVDGERENDVF